MVVKKMVLAKSLSNFDGSHSLTVSLDFFTKLSLVFDSLQASGSLEVV